MSFVYTPALAKLNSTTLEGDVRALLVMTNTTADTDEDAEFIADIGTLDEYDGATYARVALASEDLSADGANDRAIMTATSPITFATLGVGTRQCQAVVLYRHVTNDADSELIAYIDGTGFPFDGNGENVSLNIGANGLIRIRNAA